MLLAGMRVAGTRVRENAGTDCQNHWGDEYLIEKMKKYRKDEVFEESPRQKVTFSTVQDSLTVKNGLTM